MTDSKHVMFTHSPIRLPALLLMWNSITWNTILLSLLLVCKIRQTNPFDLHLGLERILNTWQLMDVQKGCTLHTHLILQIWIGNSFVSKKFSDRRVLLPHLKAVSQIKLSYTSTCIRLFLHIQSHREWYNTHQMN